MRRILAVAGSVMLALALTVPVVIAAPGDVTGVTVKSATVDKTGLVKITGTIYCQNRDYPDLELQGWVAQAIGHKTTLTSGLGGGVHCLFNGPTDYETWTYANSGTYANGWMSVQIWFGITQCNEYGCWFDWFGGDNFYVKVTKR